MGTVTYRCKVWKFSFEWGLIAEGKQLLIVIVTSTVRGGDVVAHTVGDEAYGNIKAVILIAGPAYNDSPVLCGPDYVMSHIMWRHPSSPLI